MQIWTTWKHCEKKAPAPILSFVSFPTHESVSNLFRLTSILDTADASDHLHAAQAIIRGALEGHDEEHPVYLLHTSGTGILSFLDTENGVYGERRDKIYDDLEGVQDILSFPDHAFHRDVDKFVLGAGAEHTKVLKAAIISPTTVYGEFNTRKQLPGLFNIQHRLRSWTLLAAQPTSI